MEIRNELFDILMGGLPEGEQAEVQRAIAATTASKRLRIQAQNVKEMQYLEGRILDRLDSVDLAHSDVGGEAA